MVNLIRCVQLTFIVAILSIGSASTAQENWYGPLDRDWSIRLMGGAFKPEIDSQFDANTNPQSLPYESFFGTASPLMLNLGIERFVSNLGGGLSFGMTLGYWSVAGTLKSEDADLSTTDETELVLFPLTLEASYYLDSIAHSFPIVPFFRVGVDYCVWEVLDGSGDTASFVYQTADGTQEYEAFGATQGWHYAFGVQLLLDTLDAVNADAFERDAGVRNTYLGVEYRKTQIDDFGNAQSLRVGGRSINFGLYIDL
jgi:hypothetical protein